MNSQLPLPAGFHWQTPTPADAERVTELMIAHDIADFGAADTSVDDITADWTRQGFNVATDAQLIVAADGRLAAYGNVWERAPGQTFMADGFTHPEFFGRGLGTQLLRWMEQRAREQLAASPTHGPEPYMLHYANQASLTACSLLEREGFTLTRFARRMLIEMGAPPPAPIWPEGVRVRPLHTDPKAPRESFEADARRMYAVIQEAFSDLDDFEPMPFEMWRTTALDRPDFDPTLCFLAEAGDELAGAVVCFRWPDTGWVRTLSVRRPWRRHGLGLALLHHVFGVFYHSDRVKVGLGVDANNATGATRLYERAGMRIERQFNQYRKVL